MSKDLLLKRISAFIKATAPEVLAVKGGWGIGKTYTWAKALEDTIKESQDSNNKLSFNSYAYVSLFGLSSINDMKFSIFQNSTETATFSGTTQGMVAQKLKQSKKLIKKHAKTISEYPLLKKWIPPIESVAYFSVQNTLICIDDLERVGDDLSLKEVLGLISELKEQKNCSVIILLNDNEEGLGEYDKYKEKVVDYEFSFRPTPEENAEIALSMNCPFRSKVIANTVACRIRNIRVLKHIESTLSAINQYLDRDYEDVIDHTVKLITFYSWCYYSKPEEAPSIQYAISSKFRRERNGDGELSEDQKKWNLILSENSCTSPDEYAKSLAECIVSGFITENRIIPLVEDKNNRSISHKAFEAQREAWDLYTDGFNSDQTAVVNKMKSIFQEYSNYYSLDDLDQTVSLLRKLGEGGTADELIDLYFEKNPSINLETPISRNIINRINDQELLNRFQFIAHGNHHETPVEILKRIGEVDGWNKSDIRTLANISSEEYAEIFRTSELEARGLIYTALRFKTFGDADPEMIAISQKATIALRLIADESTINRMRIENSMGVDLGEQ